MASIERRVAKSGKATYRVKVRLKGHPPQSGTFDRKSDAKRWAQQTEAAIREGRYFQSTEARRHTVADLVDRFIEYELPKLPKVEKLMKTQLKWWKDQTGHFTLAELTPALISEKRDYLSKAGTKTRSAISPATVNRYLAALSIALSTAVKEWGWLESSPIAAVRKLKEPRGRVRYLSDEERKRLLEACQASTNPYLYTIVLLALSTGARKMELLSLRWSDVDLARDRITLRETKNDETRALPIKGKAKECLVKLSKVRRIDTDLLFPGNKNPQKPIVIQEPWVKALRTAQIEDFRFHDLRHSAASYLAMSGATQSEIAAILGHKTLQMVQRYAHLSPDHMASVVDEMHRKFLE